jgi:hypothetical protein
VAQRLSEKAEAASGLLRTKLRVVDVAENKVSHIVSLMGVRKGI